jgi:hypothetical protein
VAVPQALVAQVICDVPQALVAQVILDESVCLASNEDEMRVYAEARKEDVVTGELERGDL